MCNYKKCCCKIIKSAISFIHFHTNPYKPCKCNGLAMPIFYYNFQTLTCEKILQVGYKKIKKRFLTCNMIIAASNSILTLKFVSEQMVKENSCQFNSGSVNLYKSITLCQSNGLNECVML